MTDFGPNGIGADDIDVEDDDFAPLPKATYQVQITDQKLESFGSGGAKIGLRVKVLGPTHQNRVLFIPDIKFRFPDGTDGQQRYHTRNWKAVLAACGYVGNKRMQRSEEFVGCQMMVDLDIEPASEYVTSDGEVKQGKPRNVFNKFRPVSGASAPATPAPADGKPAWLKQ